MQTTEIRIGNKQSLALDLSDFRWYSHEYCNGGRGLIALAQDHWSVDFKETLKRCTAFLKTTKNLTPTHFIAPKTREQEVRVKKQNQQRALQLIDRAKPIGGTVAERYLRKRKIDTSALPPSALRQLGFVASCYHKATNSNFPALVTTVRDHANAPIAVHRIYLTQNAHKAPVAPNKLSLGSTKGASIHLTSARETLILTEGLEDGLTIVQAMRHDKNIGLWCGIGSSLTSIIIPKDTVRCVVLAVDNDPAGRGYIKELAPRLTREGFRVCIAVPTHGKDFNEMLCRYGRFFNLTLMEKYND